MTLKAPIEMQRMGLSAEDFIVDWWMRQLAARESKIIVERSPFQAKNQTRENAMFGDVWFRRSKDEAPFVTIEAKGATYPNSFSISDNEKRLTQTRWVTVRGTMGLWHCHTRDALSEAVEKGDYWTCEVRVENQELTENILDQLQTMVGEK